MVVAGHASGIVPLTVEKLRKTPLSKVPWHLRKIRGLVYIALVITIAGIAIFSAQDAANAKLAWVEARQYYGLLALIMLLVAMAPGPLTYVLPWLPLKGYLVRGRRAFGVSAFVLAVCHVSCYLGPVLYRNWHEVFSPGKLWILGLAIGVVMFCDMGFLAITSRDKAVRQLGPHRWKTWHRTVYILLPLALIHAVCVGADFGVNKAPDVTGDADAGSLIGMLIASAVWLALFIMRKKRIRIQIPALNRKTAH